MRRSESDYEKILGQIKGVIGPVATPIMDGIIENIERHMTRAAYTPFDAEKADAVYNTFTELEEGLLDLVWRFRSRNSQPNIDWLCNSFGHCVDAGLNSSFECMNILSKSVLLGTATLELMAANTLGDMILTTYLDGAYLGLVRTPHDEMPRRGTVFSFNKNTYLAREYHKIGIDIKL